MAAVYIVEGVAGAGKDTLVNQLVAALQPEERPVLVWSESAVLASWHHYYLPGVDEMRLDLTERLAPYIADTLSRMPDSVFVFNRLHVSHAAWRMEKQNDTPTLQRRHDAVVAQLHALPVLILHPHLAEAEAASRTNHGERRERAWADFLARRAADMGRQDPADLYLAQQRLMATIMERDGLPHRRVTVRHNQPIDLTEVLSTTSL